MAYPRARPWKWDCHGHWAPVEDLPVPCLCLWAHLLCLEPDVEGSREALRTLSRHDTMPHAPPGVSTDTEAATHLHKLCVQPQVHDPDTLQRSVFDIMAGGWPQTIYCRNWRTTPLMRDLKSNDIDMPPHVTHKRRVIIETAQRMQPEPQRAHGRGAGQPCKGKDVSHHGTVPRRHPPSNLLPLEAVRCQCLADRWTPVAT